MIYKSKTYLFFHIFCCYHTYKRHTIKNRFYLDLDSIFRVVTKEDNILKVIQNSRISNLLLFFFLKLKKIIATAYRLIYFQEIMDNQKIFIA